MSGCGVWCREQYDVLLLQKVEGLIGHQLEEFKLEEREVLKGMSKVFKAKKAALVRAQELELKTQLAGKANLLERGSGKKRKAASSAS